MRALILFVFGLAMLGCETQKTETKSKKGIPVYNEDAKEVVNDTI